MGPCGPWYDNSVPPVGRRGLRRHKTGLRWQMVGRAVRDRKPRPGSFDSCCSRLPAARRRDDRQPRAAMPTPVSLGERGRSVRSTEGGTRTGSLRRTSCSGPARRRSRSRRTAGNRSSTAGDARFGCVAVSAMPGRALYDGRRPLRLRGGERDGGRGVRRRAAPAAAARR